MATDRLFPLDRFRLVFAAGLSVVLVAAASAALGQQLPDAQQAAASLLASTVTVRISPADLDRAPLDSADEIAGISVCSGVSLSDRMVVTFSRAPASSRFRVTLPDGEQSAAELRVQDTYSGLVLLEIDREGPPALKLTDQTPPVGAPVVAAAAAGIEPPVVSLGILAGVDRTVSGAGLPPVLQCDVRTTDTSSGAPVVDQQGHLIGVVAASSREADGWTYAIPARHVERLLRVRPDKGYRLLRRQRPIVGLTMRAGRVHGTVEVERVEPGGPAEQAGIRAGDLVREAEGRKIRSPYQAVAQIIRRQPGDAVALTIEQPTGETKTVAVTLGGAFEHALSPTELASDEVLVGPQLEVRASGDNSIQLRQGRHVREVAVAPGDTAGKLPRDEVELLRAQLSAFEKVIVQLQSELERRNQEHVETQQLIKSLTREISELRKQLAPPQRP
jgi:S1-C subfamily serine protease